MHVALPKQHCGKKIGDVQIIYRTLYGSEFLLVALYEFLFGQKKSSNNADAKNLYAYWWVLLLILFFGIFHFDKLKLRSWV